MNLNRKLAVRLAAALLALTSGHALAQAINDCGELESADGPFDYRTDKNKLGVVEKFHFGTGVETPVSGKSGSLGIASKAAIGS